jgi:hypothetical protein
MTFNYTRITPQDSESQRILEFSESQLVAFGLKSFVFCRLRKSKINLWEIATGAFLQNFRILQSSLRKFRKI